MSTGAAGNGQGGGGTGAAGGGQGGGGGTGAAAPNLMTFVPEAYKGSNWVKENMTSPDKFFKFVDNLNSALGKKGVIIPGEGATPEEIAGFRKGLGVPDNPDAYEFENAPELKDLKRNPEVEKVIKKMFHDAGIPKDAAKKLQMSYEKMLFDEHQKGMAKGKELDAAFDKEVAKLFGDKKDTALAEARKLLKDNIPPEIGVKLEQLNNDALLVMTAALDGIIRKYVKEDGFTGGKGAAAGGGETFEALSAAQRELMKNPAFKDFRHADHKKVMAENNVLMEKMRALQK
jgi:hypothetical protein